jgi:FkbM family methyltransferase
MRKVRRGAWRLLELIAKLPPSRSAAAAAVVQLRRAHLISPRHASSLLGTVNASDTRFVTASVWFPPGRSLRLTLPANISSDLLAYPLLAHPREGSSYRVFAELASRAESAVDVGANFGVYTYLAAAVMPAGSLIVSVEPQPVLAATIERNVARNQLRGVDVVCAAAGEEDGSGLLYVPEGAEDMASLHPNWVAQRQASEMRVPIVRLDTILTRPPDIVKLDIEQHERAALSGLARHLRSSRPDLLIELVGPEAHRGGIAEWLVGSYGYDVYYIAEGLHRVLPRALPYRDGFFNFLFTVKPGGDLQASTSLQVEA